MLEFDRKEDLKLAFKSNFLTKKLKLMGYEDLRKNENILILRESKVDLLFIVKGEREVALINVNCQNKRIKMKVMKMSKNLLTKAVDFAKKGGINED